MCGRVQVVKLHTKLGKPIPSTDPVLVTTSGNSTVAVAKATSSTVSYGTSTGTKTVAKTTASSVNVVKKVVSTPKITFVGMCLVLNSGFRLKVVLSD